MALLRYPYAREHVRDGRPPNWNLLGPGIDIFDDWSRKGFNLRANTPGAIYGTGANQIATPVGVGMYDGQQLGRYHGGTALRNSQSQCTRSALYVFWQFGPITNLGSNYIDSLIGTHGTGVSFGVQTWGAYTNESCLRVTISYYYGSSSQGTIVVYIPESQFRRTIGLHAVGVTIDDDENLYRVFLDGDLIAEDAHQGRVSYAGLVPNRSTLGAYNQLAYPDFAVLWNIMWQDVKVAERKMIALTRNPLLCWA